MLKLAKPVTILILLSFTSGLFLNACTSTTNTAELEEKITNLETENKSLKAQVEVLKEAFSKEKAEELTKALSIETDKNNSNNKAIESNTLSSFEKDISKPTDSKENKLSKHIELIDLEEIPTKELIEDLNKLSVFDSTNNKFEPLKQITRAEYIKWLFNAYNALEPESKQLRFAPQCAQIFKDTPPSHPLYKYIQALANAGYSIGYEDDTFKPDSPLTREEMIGIKVGIDAGKTLAPYRSQMECTWKFSDGKDVAERFTGYIHQDYYISGHHGSNIERAFGKIGTLHPKQAVLRYEAAGTLWQMGQFGNTTNTNAESVLKEKSLD